MEAIGLYNTEDIGDFPREEQAESPIIGDRYAHWIWTETCKDWYIYRSEKRNLPCDAAIRGQVDSHLFKPTRLEHTSNTKGHERSAISARPNLASTDHLH